MIAAAMVPFPATRLRPLRGWQRLVAALLLAPALVAPLQAQTAVVEPDADQLLESSLAYVGELGKFGFEARTSLEVVLKTGQKIQLGGTLESIIQRPDRMRVRRGNGLDEQIYVYDGRSLALWNPARNEYVSLPAPDTIDKMLDFARERLGVVAPAGDLIGANAYANMMDGVTSGFVVGKGLVEGVRCVHLAFRAPQVDWQIWIEDSPRPLPRKLVITTRDQVNEPQFEVVITKWDLQPRIDKRTFAFVVPKGAQKIELAPHEPAAPAK